MENSENKAVMIGLTATDKEAHLFLKYEKHFNVQYSEKGSVELIAKHHFEEEGFGNYWDYLVDNILNMFQAFADPQ